MSSVSSRFSIFYPKQDFNGQSPDVLCFPRSLCGRRLAYFMIVIGWLDLFRFDWFNDDIMVNQPAATKHSYVSAPLVKTLNTVILALKILIQLAYKK